MNSSLEQLSCYEKKLIIVSICFYCNAGIDPREEKDVTHHYLLPSAVPTVFPEHPPYKQTHGSRLPAKPCVIRPCLNFHVVIITTQEA